MLFACKAFATDFATERRIICMRAHMIGQMLFSRILFTAHSALMRRFTCYELNAENCNQFSEITNECFIYAFPFTCMPHIMVDVMFFSSKWFLANVTSMRRFSGVSKMEANFIRMKSIYFFDRKRDSLSHMILHMLFSRKCLCAILTAAKRKKRISNQFIVIGFDFAKIIVFFFNTGMAFRQYEIENDYPSVLCVQTFSGTRCTRTVCRWNDVSCAVPNWHRLRTHCNICCTWTFCCRRALCRDASIPLNWWMPVHTPDKWRACVRCGSVDAQ